MPRLVTVAVPVPYLDALTYRAPEGVEVTRGARVVVPLGRRTVTGLVLGVHEDADAAMPTAIEGLRDIARVLDTEPFLPTAIVDLGLWISDYYLCTPGEALGAAMPPLAWLESARRWQISEAGRQVAAAGGRGRAAAILGMLLDGRSQDLAAIQRQTTPGGDGDRPQAGSGNGRSTTERWLRRLEKEGLIASAPVLLGRADASKTERVVELVPGIADVILTARQQDALDTIHDLTLLEGLVSVPRVAEEGVTPSVLSSLERKGCVRIASRRVERLGEGSRLLGEPPLGAEPLATRLTGEQAEALERLTGWADAGAFRVVLLHGVTGSGKTEVYRRIAQRVWSSGRQVLVLVPEIALTPAVAGRFRVVFGDRLAIQHSGLSAGERHDQWQRIRRGQVDVVVGTRSAVFAPLERLGLVIVDEEHDASYKQEETPRYHGRDVALVRARAAGALVVLGSATPAMESYQNVVSGRYDLLTLKRRVHDCPLAEVRVVNMREEFADAGPEVVLSAALCEAIKARLVEREQAMILLNRRGFAANVFCRQCGDTLDCPNCSVSLTVHRGTNRARCHYCDYARRLPDRCQACGATYLEYQGIGTERVEAELRERFPDARVARLDRDTVRRRGEIIRILRGFGRGEFDILVGTQMIAKGHDFPAVTLVGVVSADVGLGMADFRAAERTFQLLTQVAGRAGRGERAGEAIIQTLVPEHYAIQLARGQDYDGFFAQERQYRHAMRYPPAVSLINLVVRGRTEQDAGRDAVLLADALRQHRGFKVLGPAPAPLARLRGYHRVQLFLKGTHRVAMRQAVRRVLERYPHCARSVSVDVDPLTVL